MRSGAAAAVGLGVAGFVGWLYTPLPTYDEVPKPDIQLDTDPAVLERGEYLVHSALACANPLQRL